MAARSIRGVAVLTRRDEVLDADVHRVARDEVLPDLRDVALELHLGHTFTEHTQVVDAELIVVGHIAHDGILAVEGADPNVAHKGSARCLTADQFARVLLLRVVGQIDGDVDKDVLDLALVVTHERTDDVAVDATDGNALFHREEEVFDDGVGRRVPEQTGVLRTAGQCASNPRLYLDR